MDNKKLIEQYESTVNDLVKVFAVKNEIKDYSWIGNRVGELVDLGEGCVVDFRDIATDIRENQPQGELKRWFDYRFRIYQLNTMANMAVLKDLNYEAWIKGAPRYSDELLTAIENKWEKLRQEHGDIVKDMQEMVGESDKVDAN